MHCGESAGGSMLPERYEVTGRLVRFQIFALSQRCGHHLTSFHLAVDVTTVTVAGEPHRPIPGWRDLLRIHNGDRLELAGEPELAVPGLRPSDVLRMQVVRDGPGFRAVEMTVNPETTAFLQGRVCEVRPVRGSSTVPMIAVRLDVHDVFGAGGRLSFDPRRVPAEFGLRPWFVGPINALLCDVRVGQNVVIRTSLVEGEWRLDRLSERRILPMAPVRRASSAA